MKTLLERYIECSDRYIDICHKSTSSISEDIEHAKALDDAGKALRKEAKARGLICISLKIT